MHRILLIEDSITQLEALKSKFEKAGFQVITAKDGSEGYKKVFEFAPDLVLSDIMMPNLNGYQLCRLLKNNELTKDMPVLLLTVLDKKMDKFWGKKSGADKFILKTTSFKELEKTCLSFIKKKPVSQEMKENIRSNAVNEEILQNRINEVFDELLRNSTFLAEFRELGEHLSHERVLVEKIFELLSSFIDYNIAGIFLNSPDKKEKKILHFDISKRPVSGFVIEKIKRDFFLQMPGFSNFNLREFGHDVAREIIEENNSPLNIDKLKSILILPIVFDDKLLGGICFYNKENMSYVESKFYSVLIKELTLLMRMRYMYSESEYLSVIDGLTGLYNRRHFETNIELEFLRVRRYHADLSLAMIDIDHFKSVNDNYGHQFGDHVLKEISKIILSSFRKTDMIYRYGGEEIAVVLTETSVENAAIPLERLREKVANHVFVNSGEEINITISIGVSNFVPEEVKSQNDLIEFADKALYKAKQDGRNKLVMFSHEQSNKVL